MIPRGPMGSRRRAAEIVLLAFILVLGGEGLALEAVSHTDRIHATVHWSRSGGGVDAQFTVSTGLSSVDLRLSLLPGNLHPTARNHAVIALGDPRYPYSYGPLSDATSDATWIWRYLDALGAPAAPPIGLTDSSALPSILAAHPNGTLLILNSGLVPSSVLSPTNSTLADWIRAGGTLVWAGGPIGYAQATIGPDGSFEGRYSGWAGQVELLGFNLTSPPPPGVPDSALFGSAATPLSAALGLTYSFAADGANVSALEAHGGTSIGWEVAAGALDGLSARTSIAFLPVGNGTLWYFGGGTAAPGIAQIPAGSPTLSQEIALLLDLGYVPGPGASSTRTAELRPLTSATYELGVPGPPAGVVAIVLAPVPGSTLYVWSEVLTQPVVRADPTGRRR